MDSIDAITPVAMTTSRIAIARPSVIYLKDPDDHLYEFNQLAQKHNVVLIALNAPSKKPLPTGLSNKTEKLGKALGAIGLKIKYSLSDKKTRAKLKVVDILEQQSLEQLSMGYGVTKVEQVAAEYQTNRDIQLPRFLCTMLAEIARQHCKLHLRPFQIPSSLPSQP